MGFNRRKKEDQRRTAAEREAAARRATEVQVPSHRIPRPSREPRRLNFSTVLERVPCHASQHDRRADVSEWDGPAVLLLLTAFDRGFESRGACRHVAEDRRRRYQHHWHRYGQEHTALSRSR